jgi:histidyl-tRNA synthetase
MAQAVRAVKGTRVFWPQDSAVWSEVESICRRVFGRYGFGEIRTPVLEHTELFVRSVGESTDIVGKEMFSFEDRKGRMLSLRPEGTAPVVRAFVDAGLASSPLPARFYYLGPFFRYERPQKGRYRQFHQIGAEILGDPGPLVDAELIAMLMRFLGELGHRNLEVLINTVGDAESREAYREALQAYLRPRADELSADSQRRLETNPLRILDSKSAGDGEILSGAPQLIDHLSDESRDHFDQVVKALDDLGVATTRSPRLVRGLDYYTRTVFEIVSGDLGALDAICGGGRYDDLMQELGGAALPSIGFAIGQDRLIDTLPPEFAARVSGGPRQMVLAIGQQAAGPALELAEQIRAAGGGVILEGPRRGLGKSLKYADRLGVSEVLMLGEDEMAANVVTRRNLTTGEQETLAISDLLKELEAE